MNTAYLLTGGNMGDRVANLALALEHIGSLGTVRRASSLYETAAWGKTDQPGFLNQALELNTTLSARQLLNRLLTIEKKMGRERLEKYGPRIIDIDILLFNDEVHGDPLLKIPHPELPNRRFALAPLAEIAGDVVHPVLKIKVKEMLIKCGDGLEVRKV